MKKKVIVFFMALLLVITSVPFNVQAAESTSGTTVTINATNFPDLNFRQYLQSYYGDIYGNINNVDEIRYLYPCNKGIKDLTGVELFSNLQILHCYGNELSSLDLSGNPELSEVYCYDNKLTSIDISNNPNLNTLRCYDNALTSLDVSNCPNLKRLDCNNNKLRSLNVNHCSSLSELTCNQSQLTSLDVSTCTKLWKLDCHNNALTSLDVSSCQDLVELNCADNNLSSLVTSNINLESIDCANNQLSYLDVSMDSGLKSLNCAMNQLSSLDVSNDLNLARLYCPNNKLSRLDVSNNRQLWDLVCDYNDGMQELNLDNLLFSDFNRSSNLSLVLDSYNYNVNFSKIKGIDFTGVNHKSYNNITNVLDLSALSPLSDTNISGHLLGIPEEEKALVASKTWYTNDVPTLMEFILPENIPTVNTPTVNTKNVTISYRTHVQSIGWQPYVSNGAMAGTANKAKRLEGININVAGNSDLGVQYTTHVQSYGWLPWSSNGDMSGTEGEAKRLEAIKIQLTGADKDKYDIYYRVHAQSYGWLGWAMNGAPAGTAGYAKRLEGIQILVVKKGEMIDQNQGGITSARSEAYIALAGSSPVVGAPATSNEDPTIGGTETPNVSYRTHVQSYGWQGWKYNGQMSGTSGQAKRLEGINIKLTNKPYSGGICYTTHVQSYGWQGDINNSATWKKDGEMAGTSGQAKRLEAIMIKLTGEMAEHYDVYYRVHAQSYGWLGWAKNGDPAGTAGYAKRLEGIQIVLVPKGGAAPSNSYGGIISGNGQAYIAK